jgi:hypothetical protein
MLEKKDADAQAQRERSERRRQLFVKDSLTPFRQRDRVLLVILRALKKAKLFFVRRDSQVLSCCFLTSRRLI